MSEGFIRLNSNIKLCKDHIILSFFSTCIYNSALIVNVDPSFEEEKLTKNELINLIYVVKFML